MGFNLGDIIVDRVQYGYAETIETASKPSELLYTLTQLQDVSINITADSTDAVDNQGTLIKRFWKSKSGELSANNAMVNLNIIAAAAGEGSVTNADGDKLTMPKIITAKQNAEGTLEYTLCKPEHADQIVAETIKVNDFTNNGTSGKSYTKSAGTDGDATDSEFVYSNGKIKLPKVENGLFIIKYERKITKDQGARIINRGDKFPSTVKLTLKALVVDPCEVDTLRAAYIVIPSFQVSPELEISMTSDGQLPYNGVLQMSYCSEDKALYEIYYADDEENEED